jgi:hypothetical protein
MKKQIVYYALFISKGKQNFLKTYKKPIGAKEAKEQYLKNGFNVKFKILVK